ncbi:MAG: hypothetical protein E7117_02130 [Bacteroidales bacterium]|nr:hypothetical protein [Bacteroidales bacterium]
MKYIAMMLLSLLTFSAAAQSERYEQKYNLLVSQLGPAGVGVETVLDNWARVDSTDVKMLVGRFSYFFNKAQSDRVVEKQKNKYLGMDPILALKDSTGTDIYYFQEIVYDDNLYGQALKAADKAIRLYPDMLELRFLKANAYIAYEKESPDMASAYLLDLVRQNRTRRTSWIYEGEPAGQEFFSDAMMEYCYTFWTIGSSEAMDAFLHLSEAMYEAYPDDYAFLNNIGSYDLMVRNDPKAALKAYGKVLKAKPDDYTAIRNSVTASRKLGNMKAEKKYLHMLVKYGPEKDRNTAKARLDVIDAM